MLVLYMRFKQGYMLLLKFKAAYIVHYYYSFKIFPRFWLVKTTRRIMHYNQLLLTKFGKNFVIVTDDVKMTSKVQTDDICYFEYIWRPEQPLLWPGSRRSKTVLRTWWSIFVFYSAAGIQVSNHYTEANPALCVFIDNGNSSSRKQFRPLATVVQTLDSAIHWINHYPLDKY